MLRNVIRQTGRRTLAVLLMPAGFALAENQQSQDTRVRAKEPTVITVEARVDDLKQDGSAKRTGPAKSGRGIGAGVTATGRAVASFAQWLLNVDEAIPSERERKQQKNERSRQR